MQINTHDVNILLALNCAAFSVTSSANPKNTHANILCHRPRHRQPHRFADAANDALLGGAKETKFEDRTWEQTKLAAAQEYGAKWDQKIGITWISLDHR